jgi:hypothetical protein
VQRYCSRTEYGALFTSGGTVHGGLFMEYCSRVTGYRCSKLEGDSGLDRGTGLSDLLCRLL